MTDSIIKLLVLTTALSISNCGKKKELPIPKEQLIKVLVDIHLAEGAMQTITHEELTDSLTNAYYDQIYAMHNIDQQQFESTMEQLREDPYILSDLYTAVLDTISLRMEKN